MNTGRLEGNSTVANVRREVDDIEGFHLQFIDPGTGLRRRASGQLSDPATDLSGRVLDEFRQRRHDIDNGPDEGCLGVSQFEIEIGCSEGERAIEIRGQGSTSHTGTTDVGVDQKGAMNLSLPFRSEAVDEWFQRKPVDAQLGVIAIAGHADIRGDLGRDRSSVDLERERVDGDDRVLEADTCFPIGDLDFSEEDFRDVHVYCQLAQRQRDRGRFTRFGRGGCRFGNHGGRCRSRIGFCGTREQVVKRRQVQAVTLDRKGAGSRVGC